MAADRASSGPQCDGAGVQFPGRFRAGSARSASARSKLVEAKGNDVRSLTILATFVAAAGLASTACTPAPSAPAPTSSAPAAAKAAPTAQAGSLAAVTPAAQCEPGKEQWRATTPPRRGGTLVRATTVEFFDPTRPTGSGEPSPQVYQGLFETRGCRYGDTAMVPTLAKSYEVSPDGLVYTIKLRDNV